MKNLLNIPNILTITRIILSPFFLLIILYPKSINIVLIVLIVFIIASITDYFDGVIARKYNMITDAGKILDPIADKLMVIFALYTFAVLGLVPYWIIGIIFAREILITLHRFYLLNKGKVIASINSGKWKTGFQIAMIIIVSIYYASTLFSYPSNTQFDFTLIKYIINVIAQISIYLTLIITVYSGVEYIIALRKK